MATQSFLLALDGSKESLAAANIAWKLAEAQKAKLVALSVVDNQAIWDLLGTGLPGFIGSGPYITAYETIQKAMRSVSETLLTAFAARSENVSLETECLINEGDLLQQVFERSKEYDLVIMGRRINHGSSSNNLHSYVRTSLGKRLSAICCAPLLLIPSEKAWQKARMIISPETFSPHTMHQFLAITESLTTEREIFCAGQEKDMDELMQKVQNILPHSVKVVCSDGTDGDESVAVAMDVSSSVLLVVPTVQAVEGRSTCVGIQIQEFLASVPQLAVLVLPPYSADNRIEVQGEKQFAAKK